MSSPSSQVVEFPRHWRDSPANVDRGFYEATQVGRRSQDGWRLGRMDGLLLRMATAKVLCRKVAAFAARLVVHPCHLPGIPVNRLGQRDKQTLVDRKAVSIEFLVDSAINRKAVATYAVADEDAERLFTRRAEVFDNGI